MRVRGSAAVSKHLQRDLGLEEIRRRRKRSAQEQKNGIFWSIASISGSGPSILLEAGDWI